MAQTPKVRSFIVAAAALALVTAGVLALAPSAAQRTLADTPSTPTTASSHRQPIVLPPASAFINDPALGSVEGAGLVAPGGLVKVDGANLGDQQGSLCLRWSEIVVNNQFTANGQACLTVDDWQSARIVAQVPSELVGVPDQTAQVVAIRADGLVSSTTPIKFVATRAVLNVFNGPGSIQPVYVVCSDAASDSNSCSTNGGSHSDGYCCSTADFDGSVGADSYYLDLHYGWALEGVALNVSDGDASISAKPAVGATGGAVTVFWGEVGSFGGSATYNLAIKVIGPAGVPMN